MARLSCRSKLLAEVFGESRPSGVIRPRLVVHNPRTGQKARFDDDASAQRHGRIRMQPTRMFFR